MSKKKNILFIIEALNSGGAERALIELLNNFDYSRYSVTLCLVYNLGALRAEVPKEVELLYIYQPRNHAPINRLKRKTRKLFKRYNIVFPLRLIINKLLKEREFNTIISYLEGFSLIFHDLIRDRSQLNLSWVHCDLKSYHWTLDYINNAEYESRCYSHMDKIIFVSQGIKESFERLYKINTEKLCIPNIIDSKKIRLLAGSSPQTNNTLTITTIGTVKKIKAFDRLIRAASKLKNDDLTFRIQIIGEGPEKSSLIDLCDRLSLEKEISFLGHQTNPFPYLQATDIFINTSISEALPLVICEAMVLGVPIIATKTAGAIELLRDSQYGLMTEQNDDSIYESLKKMMTDDSLREYYKKQSLLKAEEFDVESTMSKIYSLIKSTTVSVDI